jgi:hypothetical protein
MNSREVSIHCRTTVLISRSNTGFSSKSRRKPPALISATNFS